MPGRKNLDDYEYYRTADGKNAVMLTGQQMNLITGEVKAYTAQSPVEGSGASEKVPGHYRFYNLKEGGTFAVVFLDKSCLAEANASNLKAIDLTEYIASPRNVGMLDNIDSDAIAVPNEGLLVKTLFHLSQCLIRNSSAPRCLLPGITIPVCTAARPGFGLPSGLTI